MADKRVNYSRISISFNNTIAKLDEVAKENAAKIDGNLDLVNSICQDKQGEGKYNPHITVRRKDGEPVEESDKPVFLRFIQEYVKYFVGKDYAKLVKEADLKSIIGAEPELSSTSELSSGTTSESSRVYISRADRWLSESLDMIFEGAPTDPPTSSSNPAPIVGYGVDYKMVVQGEPKTHLPGIGSKSNSLMSGLWADIANLQLKDAKSGKSFSLSKLFNNEIVDRFRRSSINIEDVDNNIAKVIQNDPDLSRSHPEIMAYSLKVLKQKLERDRKFDSHVAQMFDKYEDSGCEYAVTIAVHKTQDPAVENYNTAKVAEICTKAFGDALKIKFNRNTVDKEDVLKITDYHSDYKYRNKYNRQAGANSDAGRTVAESTDLFILKNDIAGRLMDMLFESDVIEEATKKHEQMDIINLIRKLTANRILRGQREIKDQIRKRYSGGDSSSKEIADKLNSLFDGLFKCKTEDEMAKYVHGNFRDSAEAGGAIWKKGNNTMDAFWRCLNGAGIEKLPVEITVEFTKKDPGDDTAPIETVKKLTAQAGKFNSGDYPTSSDVAFDGYEFVGWNEDPNSLTSSGQVDAQYAALSESADISTDISSDIEPPGDAEDSEISVVFMAKNPTKKNAIEKPVGTLVAPPGEFNEQDFPVLSAFKGYTLDYWNPDPNEFTSNRRVKDITKKIVAVPNKTFAVFTDDTEKETVGLVDLYIVAHKALGTNNRKEEYTYANDGTATAKKSDRPYRAEDFRR